MSAAPPASEALSAVKLALLARDARAQAGAALASDPIAIIGMGCRTPGGGDTPEKLWSFLCEGRNVVRDVPADRWDAAAWTDDDPDEPGKTVTKAAGFLDAIDGFDASYFGILPREAEQMDPQQRLFLEVAVEAIEDAGGRFETLRGSRTGVFAASYHNDYAQSLYRAPKALDQRTLTGTLHSVIANRLSFLLDLRGPSVSVDTACSASLVAIHLACQSLRTGESDLAIAGGVSAILQPELMVAMSKLGFLAPDGRCKTFDASADGFGRGEGCGAIVLKRLADAITDGDRVWAVIRGSAVNQDGESTLLAAPNGPAQAALVNEALANARLDPKQVTYIEAHGTGTALGDPIEVEALNQSVGAARGDRPACLLGAVKANIGHLEAAAGVVGLIKAALVLRHGEAPPQPCFKTLNPYISLEGSRLCIPTEMTPLADVAGARAAGVSSFGVGGTNAHIILEEAPKLPSNRTADANQDAVWVLPLSARDPVALDALAHEWGGVLGADEPELVDLLHTAACRRSHHPHRLAVVGRDRAELAERLAARATERALDAPTDARPRLVFVFSGQGPQWCAMGRELLASEPVFRDVIERCDAALAPLAGWSLLEELNRGEDDHRLGETQYAQPALFAVQAGLAALWRSWGVAPNAVVGHSVGEIAALHAAGVVDLDEAVRIAFHRGRIMNDAEGRGGMAAVALSEQDCLKLVARWPGALDVAAVNGPESTVVSGETEALDALVSELDAQGIEHRRLPVRYAFHSAQMAPFEARLAADLGAVKLARDPGGADVAFWSTVTGAQASAASIDAAYIARNVRAPVRFADAIAGVAAEGPCVFVEVGPHPVLAASILESAGEPHEALFSLRRGRPERASMLDAVARLYERGFDPDWERLAPSGDVVSLPAYPWSHRRYWRAPPAESLAPSVGQDTGHPLLGRRLAVAGEALAVFEGDSEESSGWLADHRVHGRLIAPGAAVMETLLAAARRAIGDNAALHDVVLCAPLPAPEADEPPVRWQVVVNRAAERSELSLYVLEGDGAEPRFTLVATAQASSDVATPPEASSAGAGNEALDAEAITTRFEAMHVEFGPTFRLLSNVQRGAGRAEGLVATPPGAALDGHLMHPCMIDAGIQLVSLASAGEDDAAWLPIGAEEVTVVAPSTGQLLAVAQVRSEEDAETRSADIVFRAADADARIVGWIKGARFARVSADMLAVGDPAAALIHDVVWEDAEAASPARVVSGSWLLLGEEGDLARALSAAIAAAGGSARRADGGDPDAVAWLGAAAEPRRIVDLSALAAMFEPTAGVEAAVALVQTCIAHGVSAQLTFVTRGAQSALGHEPLEGMAPNGAALWGFAGVAALEHPELTARCVDLDAAAPADAAGLLNELAEEGPRRVALRGERRLTPALTRRAPQPGAGPRSVRLRVGVDGYDALEFAPCEAHALGRHDVCVAIRAAGLNFRDVLSTLGMYPGERPPLGVECAGEVIEVGADVRGFTVGDRVLGFAPGSMGEEVVAPAAFFAPQPPGLSDAEAAGVTVAFATALYGLDRIAGLKRGERVLIHAGAGGVGMAAIQLAVRAGAEVYATAGTPEKRAMLVGMGVAKAMDSRSLAFEPEILEATGGAGVDVVLNSLAGDFIPASVRVLAERGRFLELGKRDLMTPDEFAALRPNGRYVVYDLGADVLADHAIMRPLLDEILAGIAAGELKALPTKVFALDRLADAMRFMAAGRHVGKIVLAAPPRAVPPLRANGTYWITGGLGGLGLATAEWLVERGARSLVLSGRSAPDADAEAAIARLEDAGAAVRVVRADVGDRAALKAALADIARDPPPLRGIFHAAGALRDHPIATLSPQDVADVLHGKLEGARLLDELTRGLSLDMFVLYSAAGNLLGAPGQAAYAAANAALDEIAHARRRDGLPGLAVAWGSWADVGMAATLAGDGRDVWGRRGLSPLAPKAGFAALERLLGDGSEAAAVMSVDWSRFIENAPDGTDRSFFRHVDAAPRAARRQARSDRSLAAELAGMPADRQRTALAERLAAEARRVIGLEPDTPIEPGRPLKEVGLDSLMAVELRNAVARAAGVSLPATLLFDYPTIERLMDRLAEPLGLQAAADDAPSPDVDEFEGLSEEDLSAILEAELSGSTGSEKRS